jgi:hypothetical protein
MGFAPAGRVFPPIEGSGIQTRDGRQRFEFDLEKPSSAIRHRVPRFLHDRSWLMDQLIHRSDAGGANPRASIKYSAGLGPSA